ncbi:MAG: hypothetical protein AUG51_12915 [Acidobacteria bacterium 13_1_20CM_3_53_8]|nr:MAG: hypothetical protein AUG51_12915 [Acidobacteria bacterium 13_1_20CM_3_53_8]
MLADCIAPSRSAAARLRVRRWIGLRQLAFPMVGEMQRLQRADRQQGSLLKIGELCLVFQRAPVSPS